MTVLIVLFTSPMYIICKGMRVNILSDNPIGPMVSHTLYLFEKKKEKKVSVRNVYPSRGN
jgi:hypothetical protein